MPLRSGRPYLIDAHYLWMLEPRHPDTLHDTRRLMRVEKKFIRKVVSYRVKGYTSDMPFDRRWLWLFRRICMKNYAVREAPEDCYPDAWMNMYDDDLFNACRI